MNLGLTKPFYHKRYKVNNPEAKVLEIGDTVIVHPTNTSISREPFEATIIAEDMVLQTVVPKAEICTSVEGGYKAVINDYLFNRLEPK